MDLFALETVSIVPGQLKSVRTGISVAIPTGCVGLIWDKSGLAIKEGLKTVGGVIDSGYRGEIMVGMVIVGGKPYTLEAGHKVAQMLIQRVESPEIVEAESLDETRRGAGGFGSTGK